MESSPRRSPLHGVLESLSPHWGDVAGMPVALDFADPAAETAQAHDLALCDVSALPRLVVKGPGACAFLDGQRIETPDKIGHWLPLGRDGLIARTGAAEFFAEDEPTGETVSRLERTLR